MKPIEAVILAALVVIASDLSLRIAECGVACRIGGWDGGTFQALDKNCYCYDRVPYETATKKRLTLPKYPAVNAPERPAVVAPVRSYSEPWSF